MSLRDPASGPPGPAAALSALGWAYKPNLSAVSAPAQDTGQEVSIKKNTAKVFVSPKWNSSDSIVLSSVQNYDKIEIFCLLMRYKLL